MTVVGKVHFRVRVSIRLAIRVRVRVSACGVKRILVS